METTQALSEFIIFLKKAKKAHATVIAYQKDIDQFIEYLKKAGKTNIARIIQRNLRDAPVAVLPHPVARSAGRELGDEHAGFKICQ